MSDSDIGWIDRQKMKAALEALRSSKRHPKPRRQATAPTDDFVDLFGVQRPAPFTQVEPPSGDFVQPSPPLENTPDDSETPAPQAPAQQTAITQPTDTELAETSPFESVEDSSGHVAPAPVQAPAPVVANPWIQPVQAPAPAVPASSSFDESAADESATDEPAAESTAETFTASTPAGQTQATASAAAEPAATERAAAALFPDGSTPDDDKTQRYEQEAAAMQDFMSIGQETASSFGAAPLSDDNLMRDLDVSAPVIKSHAFGEAFAILRSGDDAHEPRHADQEVGYESAIPELTRNEPVDAPVEPYDDDDFYDDDDDEPLGISLPPDELDLSLPKSLSSSASINRARDTIDISEALTFDDDDFDFSRSGDVDEFSDLDGPLQSVREIRNAKIKEPEAADLGDAEDDAGISLNANLRLSKSDGEQGNYEAPGANFSLRQTLELPAIQDDAISHVEPPRESTLAASSAQGSSERVAPAPFFEHAAPRSPSGVTRPEQSGVEPMPATHGSTMTPAIEPSIQPDILGTLRWRQAPKSDDFSSVLAWLNGLGEWVTALSEATEFFVGDESGLSLTETTVNDGVIAVSVALRQSMAALHKLHNASAPGFTAYRHDHQRYMNMLWVPTAHGVLSVGIINDEVYPDARLEKLSEQLAHAVETMPFID